MKPSCTMCSRLKTSVVGLQATTAWTAVSRMINVLRERWAARGRGPCRIPKSCAAFSLLEILIALGILAGGLIAVLRTSHGTLDALIRSRGHLFAGLLLREQTDRASWSLRADPAAVMGVDDAGLFPQPYTAYGWRQTMTPIDRTARLWSMDTVIESSEGHAIQKATAVMFVSN